MFSSQAHSLGSISLPSFTGKRLMMMPFDVRDPDTLSESQVGDWKDVVLELLKRHGSPTGIGYLTIDEALVEPGKTQRRPGLHVDGNASYGGGPAYGGCGMILVANTMGTRAWIKEFDGSLSGTDGCEHLRDQCPPEEAVVFGDKEAWWCGPSCVHEGVPVQKPTLRQLMRISLPSMAPYHWPYTANVTGVVPVTPPGPDRSVFMSYRS